MGYLCHKELAARRPGSENAYSATASRAHRDPRYLRVSRKIPNNVPRKRATLPAYSKSLGSRTTSTPGRANQTAPGGVNEPRLVTTPLSGKRPVSMSSCAELIAVMRSKFTARDFHPCKARMAESAAMIRTPIASTILRRSLQSCTSGACDRISKAAPLPDLRGERSPGFVVIPVALTHRYAVVEDGQRALLVGISPFQHRDQAEAGEWQQRVDSSK